MKRRIDQLLVDRGIAESWHKAQALLLAGRILVNEQKIEKPGQQVDAEAEIRVLHQLQFASRAGGKLQGALDHFQIPVAGRVCVDLGASTGGFTDCLLQHGAARVYAIDVGKGILDWKLRQEPRVVVMEETNARSLELLPEPVSLVTIDVSFISLKVLLPIVRGWLENGTANDIIALIKPQFEAGREQVGRGKGVIRDPEIHRKVLLDILNFSGTEGYSVMGLIRSPLLGPKGNQEFLAWWGYPARSTHSPSWSSLKELIQSIIPT